MYLRITRWQDGMQVQMDQMQTSIYDQFQYQNAYTAVMASAHPELTFPLPPLFSSNSYPSASQDGDEDI